MKYFYINNSFCSCFIEICNNPNTVLLNNYFLSDISRFCISGVRRYHASNGETQPHWAFPCRCDNGCDTDTGECLNGGSCIQGLPTEYTWSGQACRTGNNQIVIILLPHICRFIDQETQRKFYFLILQAILRITNPPLKVVYIMRR